MDARLRAGPHVFVDDLERPQLRSEDEHHLARALRVAPGAAMTLSDGAGRWRAARFGDPPALDGPITSVEPSRPEITIGVALAKGSSPQVVVQKLTELGVDRIVLLAAERSVVRWDAERRAKQLARLERVAREAAMQARALRLPVLEGLRDPVELVRGGAAVAEPGGTPLGLDAPSVLVGPEGGWSPRELDASPLRVSLGPQVLRVETAAIVAGGILAARRADALSG